MHRRQFHRDAAAACLAISAVAAGASAAAGPKKKIRVGQIGTAHAHASGKLDAMRKLSDDFEVVGVVEPDPELRKMAEGRGAYKDLTWMTEEQLLSAPGLQAVAVETRVRDLVPTAMRCVKAGLHIHLDKPAGESMPAVVALHEEAKRQRVTVQMGYMLRYNPAFQLCFQAAREGMLGDIFEVHATMSKVIEGDKRHGYIEYRGGSMFELGCHVIDQLVTLLGKPDRVTAFPRNTRSEIDSQLDNQLAVFEYPRMATVNSSMLEVDGGARRQFVVCGTKGTFEILPLEPPQAQIVLTEAHSPYRRGRQKIDLPQLTGRYDAEFVDLAAVIREEKPFAWSHEHDLITHEAILQASSLPLG